jgi:hypothetical protein
MLANANFGAVSMNARISRSFVSLCARPVFRSVGMFVNALSVHFTPGLQIIVIIGQYERRLVIGPAGFDPQIIRIYLWNACPYWCDGAAQQQAGCGNCREPLNLPELHLRLMCDFIHFASPPELALDTPYVMRALCQLKEVDISVDVRTNRRCGGR